MKVKSLKIWNPIFPVEVVFCPTKKLHSKHFKKKRYYWMTEDQKTFYTDATTTVVRMNGKLELVIGLDYCKEFCIYGTKALLVHELSHCVTEIMGNLGVTCDESRSYLIQFYYTEVMKHFDKFINKGK